VEQLPLAGKTVLNPLLYRIYLPHPPMENDHMHGIEVLRVSYIYDSVIRGAQAERKAFRPTREGSGNGYWAREIVMCRAYFV
jgi:hypothetical protein